MEYFAWIRRRCSAYTGPTRSSVQHIRSARASGTRWAGPGCPLLAPERGILVSYETDRRWVNHFDGREPLESEEPMPSLIVSSPTRGYRDMHLGGHKRLRRGTTWVDHGPRRASAAPSNARRAARR